MNILERRAEHRNGNPYVFGALDDKYFYRLLTKRMNVPYTVHGFRSTFCTWGEEHAGFNYFDLDRCIQHTIGTKASQAYMRSDGLAKRRTIMDAWSQYCEPPPPVEVKRAPALVRA
jgi:hypothetical protein